MNQNILKKCIEELKKIPKEGEDLAIKTPNIQYVLGMLETLYELQEPKATAVLVAKNWPDKKEENISEAEAMDAKARAAIGIVKKITAESISDVR